jgi:hypothetical protein
MPYLNRQTAHREEADFQRTRSIHDDLGGQGLSLSSVQMNEPLHHR